MKHQEIINKIRQITGRTEQEIQEYCERIGVSLEQYEEIVDRAIIARNKKTPSDYPKAIIKDTNQ